MTGLGFVPSASASLVPGSPIPDGVNITVFHNIDFVATSGWTAGENLLIEVVRNGVVIGSAEAGAISGPEGVGLEVNHGPEVLPPADGDCWEGHTPDIRPGDTIRIAHDGGTSAVVVDNITFSGPAIEAPNGDILVKGVAKYADGTNIPLAALDSAEFRDTSKFRGVPDSVEADPAVDGGFILRYRPDFELDRNDDNLNLEQRKQSLLTSGGHAIGFGHVDPLPAEAMLVEGIDDTPGPAPGCEPAVAAVDAVQSFSDSALNQADVTAGGNLTVSGVSFAASNVAVSVGALPAVDVTPSGPADGPQTWTASVPMSAVAGLADGTVTVGMQATRGGGTIAGVSKTLSKDVVAPAAPTATPTATSFTGSTQVALSAAAGDTIRYNLGDGNQAAPTAATGQVYAGPFTLNQTATVKAIAVDAAGNVSGVMSRTFTRSVPAPPVVTPPPSGGSAAVIPLAPSIGKAKSGKRGGNDTATAKWRAPVANGAVLSGYEVRALKLRPGRSAKIRPSVAVGSAISKLRMSLPAGKYKFRVRAVSAAGKSPWSERSATVRSR